MNKLIATLALGTALSFGLVTTYALAKEGSDSHSEHSGKTESSNSNSGSSGTNSGSSTSNSGSSHEQGETDEANETEDHGGTVGTSGTGGQEAENETETGGDDAPPLLPVLTPIGPNVLLPAQTTTPQSGDVKTIY
jgi:hypothetical protein